MLEIVYLGTGAAVPAPGETNSSYLVRSAGVTLLVDCGPAVLQQLAVVGVAPGEITHLFVSHRHGDHCLGFPVLRLAWYEAREEFPGPRTVIASDATAPTLRLLWDSVFGELPLGPECEETWVGFDPKKAGWKYAGIPGLELRTWPMVHSDFAPVSALRIDDLETGRAVAFTADTTECPLVAKLGKGVDLLVHDSARSERSGRSAFHCTAQLAGKQAKAAKAKKLALVHVAARFAAERDALIAEARKAFGGPVVAPCAGEREVLK